MGESPPSWAPEHCGRMNCRKAHEYRQPGRSRQERDVFYVCCAGFNAAITASIGGARHECGAGSVGVQRSARPMFGAGLDPRAFAMGDDRRHARRAGRRAEPADVSALVSRSIRRAGSSACLLSGDAPGSALRCQCPEGTDLRRPRRPDFYRLRVEFASRLAVQPRPGLARSCAAGVGPWAGDHNTCGMGG